MGEYYFIVKIAAVLIMLMVLLACIALLGWMRCSEKLKKENIRAERFKEEKAVACKRYETLKSRELFLLNRITELSLEVKEAITKADKLSLENVTLNGRLKRSLAAVRENVDDTDTVTGDE